MSELLGIAAAVMAVIGVLLNNRLNKKCFYLWIVSNLICLYLHTRCALLGSGSGMWGMVGRDLIFIVLAVEGLIKWHKKGR